MPISQTLLSTCTGNSEGDPYAFLDHARQVAREASVIFLNNSFQLKILWWGPLGQAASVQSQMWELLFLCFS